MDAGFRRSAAQHGERSPELLPATGPPGIGRARSCPKRGILPQLLEPPAQRWPLFQQAY